MFGVTIRKRKYLADQLWPENVSENVPSTDESLPSVYSNSVQKVMAGIYGPNEEVQNLTFWRMILEAVFLIHNLVRFIIAIFASL